MDEDRTTNQELEIIDDTELVGINTGLLPSWLERGISMGGEHDEWAWMDEDTRTPNEVLADHVRELQIQCNSAYNDGWTALGYKKQLYEMKCMIEDIYNSLNVINEEEEKKWEKERVFNKLKGPENGKQKRHHRR